MVSTTAPAAISSPAAVTTPTTRPCAVETQVLDRRGTDLEPRHLGEERLHRPAVKLAVRLGARAPHRRPLAAVEHAELDAGAIDGPPHEPVEGVDLAHQMALGEAADGRVAGHLADGLAPVGQQQRARAATCRRGRGLAAGVPAAHDDDVIAR